MKEVNPQQQGKHSSSDLEQARKLASTQSSSPMVHMLLLSVSAPLFIYQNLPHTFPAGGYLAQDVGWQWDFYMPAIVTAVSFLVAVFFLPETLFSRGPRFLAERKHERSFRELLFNFRGNLIPQRRLKFQDFITSFYMLKYPSVALPFWFYTWSWTFINILPALTMAKIYSTLYHFDSGVIGLCTGIPLIIGCVLGELSAGKLSDIIMYHLAKRNNGIVKPEHRLYLTTISAFVGPAGMIIFGVCLEKKTKFIYPLIGLGVGRLSIQFVHPSSVF